MTTPLWCLLIVAAMPYLLAFYGGYQRVQHLGKLDNNYPRLQIADARKIVETNLRGLLDVCLVKPPEDWRLDSSEGGARASKGEEKHHA